MPKAPTLEKQKVKDDAAAERSPQAVTDVLSRRLRSLRQERGLSLRAVAAIAQVSPSLLSQIERGEASPSLVSLVAIADALAVRPGTLLDDEPHPATQSPVVRRGERRVIDDKQCRREYLMHVDDPNLEVAELFLPPGGSSRPRLAGHSGRDYGIVLEGKATVEFPEGTEELEEGDYIAFNANVPHRLVNGSKRNARIIWIIAHERGAENGTPAPRPSRPRRPTRD
jgi:transcriptional regulator with XRE-family HTH domain